MANELIFYKTSDGEQRIEVVYQDKNFWLSKRALAELFAVGVPAINKHLKNIFESGELNEKGSHHAAAPLARRVVKRRGLRGYGTYKQGD